MMDLFTFENLLAFLTLASLEIVLGIDNIIFIAITTERLPVEQRPFARKAGLLVAMLERILLLSLINWIAKLRTPFLSFASFSFSGRDLILILGGLFLIFKATTEIHDLTVIKEKKETKKIKTKKAALYSVLFQIFLLDTVFSFDSVITAVGMADNLVIMVLAVIVAVLVMMTFAHSLSEFILKHPTLKSLALSFLLLIGVFLIADGFGKHIEKGYIYFAISFSAAIEAINFRIRKNS